MAKLDNDKQYCLLVSIRTNGLLSVPGSAGEITAELRRMEPRWNSHVNLETLLKLLASDDPQHAIIEHYGPENIGHLAQPSVRLRTREEDERIEQEWAEKYRQLADGIRARLGLPVTGALHD